MTIEARGSVDIIPECKVRRDYVNTSEASKDLRTEGAFSN